MIFNLGSFGKKGFFNHGWIDMRRKVDLMDAMDTDWHGRTRAEVFRETRNTATGETVAFPILIGAGSRPLLQFSPPSPSIPLPLGEGIQAADFGLKDRSPATPINDD